jgi:hypothetical protein
VTIGVNLRLIMAVSLVAFAAIMGPAAQALSAGTEMSVCNTANGKGNGNNVVLAADKQGALKHGSGLAAKKGGNLNAAAHSRALALCAVPATTGSDDPPIVDDPGDTGGGDTGGGVGGDNS